jgi:hypothetical protein
MSSRFAFSRASLLPGDLQPKGRRAIGFKVSAKHYSRRCPNLRGPTPKPLGAILAPRDLERAGLLAPPTSDERTVPSSVTSSQITARKVTLAVVVICVDRHCVCGDDGPW